MKKIKCVQKRKLPNPISQKPNLQKPIPINDQYMLGSPKYNNINSNKHILQRLSNMEKTVLNKILNRKSSKNLFENYMEILEKKRKVLLNEIEKKI